MKIWDCFTYAGEKECLEIAVKELEYLNITHIAVQSNKTFTGNTKILHDVSMYKNVLNVSVCDMPDNCDAWSRESHQRNSIMVGLRGARDTDIVIIRDADEIPKMTAVERYRTEMGVAALRMDVFWYKFNYLAEKQTWTHPKILTYGELKKSSPNEVRGAGFPSEITNAGHHFSYLGDADYIINKLESYSHIEYNVDSFKDKAEIARKIENGLSLWGESEFKKVDIDESFPKYLYENQGKFKHLIA